MTKYISFRLQIGLVLGALLGSSPATLHAQETPVKAVAANDAKTEARLLGLWRGRLKVGEKVGFTLVLQVERGEDGALHAWMHSLDQNGLDLSIEKLRAQNDTINFEVPSVGGSFEGVLQGEGGDDRRLAGTWKQGMPLPLEMQPVETVPELVRPQEPARPYPYRDEQVTFSNGDVQLKGTLTLPPAAGDTKFPAIVFVQDGSPGQNADRNGRQFGHRPFLILSDWLTRAGFATLRFDTRPSNQATVSATATERTGDMAAAIKFLRARPEIDGARCGVLGWGEGSSIAARVAADDPTVAFVVLLSPVGIRGGELLILQATTMPEMKDRAAAQIEALTKITDILETEDNPVQRIAMVRQVIDKELRSAIFAGARDLKPEQQKMLNDMVDGQIKIIGSPWFREFLTHDPRQTLARVQAPVLAISGQFNTLIPARENLAGIREALLKGGNKDFTVEELPKLNYQFQPSETGKMEEYAKTKETIAPKVLELLTDWLQKRAAAK